ncbi:ABC transporter [Thauera propionica]|uniref:Transport permease protein n=1 Tax=Thauera propionica TaxID=2019431 RepID=A0A235F374_9RHOO|nr:ABC transporter permease [Thauera propionica]OYD55709.1 ABC transporter [Thauera propionica]
MKAAFELWKYRRTLFATAWSDIRGKYRGTFLGMGWSILYPIVFLILYAVVYLFIFKIRLPNYTPFEYILLIFSGLIPFLGFSESLSTGVGSVLANRGLIRNTMFPIELVPVKAVLASSVTMIVGLSILLPILWLRGTILPSQALIPLLLVLQLVFTIGLIWLLSALNVFFQDIGQMTGVMILFLMLVSPIAYTQDMIPAALMPLMYPNPLFYMIMLYRDTIILGEIPLDLLGIFTLISLTTFFSGYYVFNRLKSLFADYV